jgi:hypothetical protein
MNLIDLNQIDITQASDCNKLSYEHNYDLFDYKGFQIIKVQDRHCLGIIDDQLIFFDRFFSEEGWVKYENQEFPNANLSLEDINLADYYTVILSYPQFKKFYGIEKFQEIFKFEFLRVFNSFEYCNSSLKETKYGYEWSYETTSGTIFVAHEAKNYILVLLPKYRKGGFAYTHLTEIVEVDLESIDLNDLNFGFSTFDSYLQIINKPMSHKYQVVKYKKKLGTNNPKYLIKVERIKKKNKPNYTPARRIKYELCFE